VNTNDPGTGGQSVQLRRSSIAVIAVVVWVVLAGIGWRESRADVATSELSWVDNPRQRPPTITIDAGMTMGDIGQLLEDLGLDTANNTLAVASDISSIKLPEQLGPIDSLDGYLAPGTYAITATSDASTLLGRMVEAFADQLTVKFEHALDASGLSLSEAVLVAGLAQQGASARSELPVVAGVVRNSLVPDAQVGAVGIDALLAAVRPIQTDFTEYHVDDEGTVRLGSKGSTASDGDDGDGDGDGEGLPNLIDVQLAPLNARAGATVIGLDGSLAASSGARRFIETASVYKLAVLAIVMEEVDAGRLELTKSVTTQLGNVEGSNGLAVDSELLLAEALRRMIEFSDNASAETLLFGLGPEKINSRLRSWGIEEFNVGSHPQVATAHGVAQLLTIIASGQIHQPTSRDMMLELLRNTRQDDRLPRLIPGAGPVAHKIGDLETLVNNAGIIPTAGGDQVVVVLIEEVEDSGLPAQAISTIGQLVNSWHNSYLPAQRLASALGAEGCERPPTSVGVLSDLRIAIDPAHGGLDLGSVVDLGDANLATESSVTLIQATMLAERLTEHGATVLLTRCTDQELGPGLRAVLVNQWDAALTVSLDYQSLDGSSFSRGFVGWSRSDAEALAGAFGDPNREASIWSSPTDSTTPLPSLIVSRCTAFLQLTSMPTVVLGPGDFTREEAAALQLAISGDGDRLDTVVASTTAALLRYWEATADLPS
jgi:beta-lactamase class A